MPFAGYKDFDECVSKNRDRRDPKAYCAAIERRVKRARVNRLKKSKQSN